ncbi:hypothetical protein Tco_1414456, partial [Tanacetum coccineum]
PHTYDEIKAMVDKQIEDDKARQLVIMNLAVEYDNACEAKDDPRKAYEECNDIPQETSALIDTFLIEGSDNDYEMHNSFGSSFPTVEESIEEHEIADDYLTDGYLTEKEQQQLLLDEEALREILEEQARAKKEQDERIKQEQAHDELFRLEFGVKYDSGYESD